MSTITQDGTIADDAAKLRRGGRLKQDEKSKRERHERRRSWLIAEASRQALNRAQMARCEQFYDGTQYEAQDAQELRDRGQNPVVYNEVKPSIDWLIGTERRTRVDFLVIAEEEGEEASEDARLKTRLMKYLDDVNRATFERSFAAEGMFKAGMGWIEVGLRGDKNGAPIYIGSESWRNILHDSIGTQKHDINEGRYIFRLKVVDLDVAIAMLPEHEQKLRDVAQTGDDTEVFREFMLGSGLLTGLDAFSTGNDDDIDFLTPRPVDMFNLRERVLLIECWSREPVTNREPGPHGIADPVTFKVFCSIMTERDTLIEAPSPFKHDRFPFIPVWGYRNSRTGLPYSPILQLMGPQEALNHHISRAIYEAASNQVEIEQGAVVPEVMDFEDLRREYDDPNGMVILKDGGLGKVRSREHKGDAKAQLEFAQLNQMTIRGMSGVTGENRGLETNSQSGRAVIAKQEQGGLVTLQLFDNIMYARQMEGEMVLSLSEQFLADQMTIRTPGDKGYEYSTINKFDPESGQYLNDITARRAHFVVGEQAWKQSFAEAAFESLMQVLTQLATAAPQVVVALLDVVFDMHPNLPRKALVLERIRSVTGQTPPDGKLTPEQEAAMAKQQQIADEQFRLQMAKLQADVKEAEAKGEKLDAETMATRLDALRTAAEAASVLAANPGISPTADELLSSAGFKDQATASVLDAAAMQTAQPIEPAPEQVLPADPSALPV